MLVARLNPLAVARSILPQIFGFAGWSALAVVTHTVLRHPEAWNIDPRWSSSVVTTLVWTEPGIPFGAIAALATALAVFLGFRNGSAYDRWWEGRRLWGALVNDSRSFCRQTMAWVEPATDASTASRHDLQQELVHRHLAFVHGLALHLRRSPELLSRIETFLPAAEVDRYREVPNVPTALLMHQGVRLAELREEGRLEHFRHLQMDTLLTRLSDMQGGCERIKNTPLPRQYDAIPRWFAYFYGLLVPFGLVGAMGWATVPLSVAIVSLFLLLESAGRLIEDPFDGTTRDIPMSALSITIERDLRAALGERLPPAVVPDEHGVLP